MISLITGGAGFIGSNLAKTLVELGQKVRIVDNFSTGKDIFLKQISDQVEVFRMDLLHDSSKLEAAFENVETVYHFAANADVRYGWNHTKRDLEQNLIATLNTLDASVASGVKNFIFSSTGSIYGEAKTIPTPEEYGSTVQTSLYGASKFSAESYIEAYASAGKLKATIFRFVSILGPKYTHGHVIDFFKQLKEHPEFLNVLGDGSQRKSYLHVSDCVSGVTNLRGSGPVEIFNLGTDETLTVRESISVICQELKVEPEIIFSGGSQGWIGDNPHIHLDISKAKRYGWAPKNSITNSILDTVAWLNSNWQNLK